MIVAGVEFFFYFVLCDIRFVEYDVFQFIVLVGGGCCLFGCKMQIYEKIQNCRLAVFCMVYVCPACDCLAGGVPA